MILRMNLTIAFHHNVVYCLSSSSWSWLYGTWILQLPVQSVPITTKVVSSNPVHGEVYSIQPYVIKFVSDLRQVGGFSRYSGFLHKKTDRQDITEILLKVVLNSINPNPNPLHVRLRPIGPWHSSIPPV